MIVLASGSLTRQALLRSAGVDFVVQTLPVDEESVKEALRQEGESAAQVAETLAEMKARRVSLKQDGAIVLGADQMLDLGGEWFSKPKDRMAARAQLQHLRGKTHELISAVVALRDGQRLWHHVARARLTMRAFSDDFLDSYLDQAGDGPLSSVGAYQIEGLGAQLFAALAGDHSTILGLPLLPVLDFLRENGELKT